MRRIDLLQIAGNHDSTVYNHAYINNWAIVYSLFTASWLYYHISSGRDTNISDFLRIDPYLTVWIVEIGLCKYAYQNCNRDCNHDYGCFCNVILVRLLKKSVIACYYDYWVQLPLSFDPLALADICCSEIEMVLTFRSVSLGPPKPGHCVVNGCI